MCMCALYYEFALASFIRFNMSTEAANGEGGRGDLQRLQVSHEGGERESNKMNSHSGS